MDRRIERKRWSLWVQLALVGAALVVADEPTGNLDSKNGAEVLNLLAELHSDGTTIVMATHSSASAERAQRLLWLQDGRLVEGSAAAGDD